MGREATCTAVWNGRRFTARALLETESVIVRGDVRVAIPCSAMTRVATARGQLTLTTGEGTLVLALGDEAERWAERIRNPPSLVDKLGIEADSDVTVVGIDDALLELVRSRTKSVSVGRLGTGRAMVIAAVNRAADLRRFGRLRGAIAPDGVIWTIRPKGVAEISESAVRAAALAAGLVDVKVARVSATHTAEKFVIPKALRPVAVSRTT